MDDTMKIMSSSNSYTLSEGVAPTGDTIDTGTHITQLILHSFLLIFGVSGNCLILRVYWTKTLKTSTHVLITALAWADLSVSVLRLRRISVEAIYLTGDQIPQAVSITWALASTAVGSSVIITAVIAADRYDSVCRPHRRLFTYRRGKMAAWTALLVSFAANIPAFLSELIDPSDLVLRKLVIVFQLATFLIALVMIAVCYGLVYQTIRKHVKVGAVPTYPTSGGLARRQNNVYPTRRQPGISKLVLPVFTLSKSSCSFDSPSLHENDNDAPSPCHSTKMALWKSQSARRDQSAVSADAVSHQQPRACDGRSGRVNDTRLQRRTTRMLFITSVVFLLLWLSYWISIGMEFASYGGATVDPVLTAVVKEIRVTLHVNSVINPLIYGLANRQFRKDCREVFCKIRLR